MRFWTRAAIAVGVLLLLTAGVTALFGPDLLRRHTQEWVRAETGRTLELGKASINLLALSIELFDVTLTETDGTTPFVHWERLYVALSPRSLWHRAPVVRELELDKPLVRIERLAEGRFNFSNLFEPEEPAPPSETAAAPARFSLNNLVIRGGRLEFLDRTLEMPTPHRVEELELAIPFVGNLPYLADRYVEPLLRATVDGTPFELKGELKPFADTQEYLLKLKFDGIDLPRYLGYLPVELPVTLHNGKLDTDLDVVCRVSAVAKPVLELTGRLDLSTFDLRERNGRPLLFFPLLETRLAPSRPLDLQFHLAAVTFNNPQAWLDRDPAGAWNVSRLAGATRPAAAAADDDPAESAPPRLQIDQLRLRKGRLELRDHLPAERFTTVLTDLNLAVDGFTLAPKTPFQLSLNLASERRERLGISGQVTANPLALDLAVETTGIPLAAYQPYYRAQSTNAIGGELQGSAHLRFGTGRPLLLSDLALGLRDLELPLTGKDGLRIASAELRGGRFDLAANRLEVADLALNGADLRFSRSKDGHWSFHDRNYPLLAGLAEAPGTAPAPAPERAPFHYRFGRIALGHAQLSFRDELPAEPVQLDLRELALTIEELATPGQVPAKFELQGHLGKQGNFQVRGLANPTGPETSAVVQLRRIPLATFAPYLEERFRLELVDGTVDATLQTAAIKQGDHWRGRLGGTVDINRFYCLDAAHREELLRWERLQISGIDAQLEPLSLKVAAVAVNNYYARVLLDEQARLNLAEVFMPPSAPAQAGGAAPPPSSTAQPAAPPAEVRIGKITLQGGKVNFTDRHMAHPFSAEMLQLGGRIEGLSSTPGARAEIDLRGRLRNTSPLTIAGTLNPLAEPLFLDLKLDFTDIELSPFSPYSGTYIGYLIDKGKLNVELKYLVENGKLDSSNRIFLDQLTFGDAVASDRATTLPVRLAVALLKDQNGEIHLDIPVSGSLDDPQFSIWGIVWKIVRNLLVKAATSPLALLGALAADGEAVTAIAFPPGSAILTEPERAKVAKIAATLRDRTSLSIEIKGYVDPDHDPEGYRQELLQERIRREKLVDLRKRLGEAAPAETATVVVSQEEYPDYLWRVYKAADFPKPRNFIGLVKHLPDEELEKLLLANIRIGDHELAALALARSQEVAAALVASGDLPAERVFITRPDAITAPPAEDTPRSRVEFGITVR